MNFNLVEMYNGLLRFNKHILNELAEGLKHLPNLDGVSKGDSLIINEQGNPTGWAKPLENGFVPPLDESDGDVGARVPEFYMCVKDTGTKYQLWISDFNIESSSVVATKLQGRPRTGINYDKANEFCANRGDWITKFLW